MKFVFDNSEDKLVGQVCFNLENLQQGLYQKAGYQVLPYLPESYKKGVYVPDLEYSDEFWQEMKSAKPTNYGARFPDFAHEFIKNKLATYSCVNKIDTEKKEKEWLDVSNKFLADLESIFGSETFDIFEKVEILQTPFGSPGSFCPQRLSNGKYFLPMCLRYDMPVGYIGDMLISVYYIVSDRNSSETGESGFFERMATVRFLREKSILKKYFTDEKTVSTGQLKKYLVDSDEYLTKLGFSASEGCKIAENNDLIIHNKVVNEYFTRQEKSVILKFIHNSNHVLSYDIFADILWKDDADEKYSMYAIAKVIENVRRKLRELGLKKDRIKTVRGEGYVWME